MRTVLAAFLMLFPFAADAATLTIHVANISPKGGTLRLSLYDEFGWSSAADDPIASANVPAVAPETTVVLKDLKPGVYGVKTYQDANNNDKFDKNFIGLPQERYGFSHDAKVFMSEPSFDRACFTLKEGAQEITIHLK